MVREFADCPMTCMADGRKMLNLQYVEGALCEFRKFVTEQPQLAVLCGKIRARSGLKYLPKCGTAGGSEAASDYARWLSIVRCCVVNTWNTPDRTDRKIWAAADFGCSDRRSASASVGAVCSSVFQGIKTTASAPYAGADVGRLHPKMSARTAAELGEIHDVLDMVITAVDSQYTLATR